MTSGQKLFSRFFGLFSTVLLLTGCGRNAQSAASHGDKAFKSAPTETKTAWGTATTAVKNNDFALALATLGKLHSAEGLTVEQKKAIEETSTALSDKMYDAANRGDANAKKALDDLRQLQPR